MVSLRICRHCRKPVSLDATKCTACRGALMSPRRYKAVLGVMALILAGAYGYLAYAVVVFVQALRAL